MFRLPDVVEALLTHKNLPQDHWYFDNPPTYCFEGGERAFGPEAWQATRATELAATAPRGTVVLLLILWSDGTDSASGSRHVMRISLGNLSILSRLKDEGARLLAILPQVQTRKPQGMHPERRSTDQTRVLGQLRLDSVAHVLAEADALMTRGGVMHTINGVETLCVYRVHAYVADKMEDVSLTATAASHDPRSYAVTHAKAAAARDGGKTYLRTDDASRSSTAERRTPGRELARQYKFIKKLWKENQKNADALASPYGQKCYLNVQLHTFAELLPWSLHGIYGSITMDFLHVVNLGIIPKFAKMLVALIIREFRREADFQSYEDARRGVEVKASTLRLSEAAFLDVASLGDGLPRRRASVASSTSRLSGAAFLGVAPLGRCCLDVAPLGSCCLDVAPLGSPLPRRRASDF
jgi:hypothetical protein